MTISIDCPICGRPNEYLIDATEQSCDGENGCCKIDFDAIDRKRGMSETIGFYGGKFLPMHKGHLYCIDTAARMCDHVVVILFAGGDDELRILKDHNDPELDLASRQAQAERVCTLYPNVEFQTVDVTNLKLSDGSEDWDAETPLVRQYVPKMDYVFSSEPGYGEYFSRAYPEAQHIIVDAERKTYPISSTMIRAMKLMEEKEQWMV